MTRQTEALSLIQHIIAELSTHPHGLDLKAVLRRGQHACELLGWQVRRHWFHQELNGYEPGVPAPAYRVVRGTLAWEPTGSLLDRAAWASQEILFGREGAEPPREDVTFDARGGIDWLTDAAAQGYREPTEWTFETPSEPLSRPVVLRAVKVFPPIAFASVLSAIQQATFTFASQAYAQLLAEQAALDDASRDEVAHGGNEMVEPARLFLLLSGERLSLNDLKDVCLLINVDWDTLPGDAKGDKARALIQHMQRRGTLGELRDALLTLRPDLTSLFDEA